MVCIYNNNAYSVFIVKLYRKLPDNRAHTFVNTKLKLELLMGFLKSIRHVRTIWHSGWSVWGDNGPSLSVLILYAEMFA